MRQSVWEGNDGRQRVKETRRVGTGIADIGRVAVRFVERLPDGRVIVQPPLDDRGLLTFIVARGAAGGIELLELPAGSPRLAA